MERPLFKWKVDRIRSEFTDRLDDMAFLELAAHELSFRSTLAARTLRRQINERIEQLRRRTGSAVSSTRTRPPASPQPAISESTLHRPAHVEEWPRNLLSAWIALEVLSPQTFRKVEDLVDSDHKRIARLARSPLPWANGGEPSRPKKKLFYQVLLGVVRMREASNELLSRYTDASPEFRPLSGYTPIAIVTLDKSGVPIAVHTGSPAGARVRPGGRGGGTAAPIHEAERTRGSH